MQCSHEMVRVWRNRCERRLMWRASQRRCDYAHSAPVRILSCDRSMKPDPIHTLAHISKLRDDFTRTESVPVSKTPHASTLRLHTLDEFSMMRTCALLLLGVTFILFLSACRSEEASGTRVFVYRNGGNNTAEGFMPVEFHIDTSEESGDIEFNLFKLRALAKLQYMPHDCTPWSPTRPKKPWNDFQLPVDPELEPDPSCDPLIYTTYLNGTRIHDSLGRQLHSLQNIEDGETLFVVPPGDHFFWPGFYIGREIVLPNVVIKGEHHLIDEKGELREPNDDEEVPADVPIRLRTISLQPRAFLVPQILTDAEAKFIVKYSNDSLHRSLGFHDGGQVVTDARTSKQTWLNCPGMSLACRLEKRIAKIIHVSEEHMLKQSDAMQVLHYAPGEKYDTHTDWFDPTQAPLTPGLKEGYNRMITVFYYLNSPTAGGETIFPHMGIPELNPGAPKDANPYRLFDSDIKFDNWHRGQKMKPVRLSAVVWYNMLAPGNGHEAFVDQRSLHGAVPPAEGTEKWAANKWIYNHKWATRDRLRTWVNVEEDEERQWRDDLVVLDKAPTDGDYQRMKAVERRQSLSVTFVNQRSDLVTIDWIEAGSGALHKICDIKAGKSNTINSFIGHRFRASIMHGTSSEIEVGTYMVSDTNRRIRIR